MFENISVSELKEKFVKGEKFRLIDVRELSEYNLVHLDRSEHFPLDRLYLDVLNMQKDIETIVYCHHGNRSMKACMILVQNGFKNVKNLKGGIDEYSLKIDPDLKRY
jgi:sulfur-carrier protein adenylyltransferase/sulfurtransferase